MAAPNGKDLAFTSTRRGPLSLFRRPGDASGRDELLAQAEDGLYMSAPDWSPADNSMSSDIPQRLFRTGLAPATDFHAYDVSRDGTRFLIPVFGEDSQLDAITVVTNWTKRVPQ